MLNKCENRLALSSYPKNQVNRKHFYFAHTYERKNEEVEKGVCGYTHFYTPHSLSHTHTRTQTHTLSLSLSHTHTHTHQYFFRYKHFFVTFLSITTIWNNYVVKIYYPLFTVNEFSTNLFST